MARVSTGTFANRFIIPPAISAIKAYRGLTEIEQEFAGKFKLGTRVRIEDDTNVEPLGQGTITYVSDWFLPRRFHLQDPTMFNSGRTVECIVALEPGHTPVRLGHRVRIRLP